MDGLFMSVREQQVFRVVEDFRARRLSRKEAALKLDISERTVTRVAAKLRTLGLKGVKHQNTGKASVRKFDDGLRLRYIERYRAKYRAFNFVHALEMMTLHEEFEQKVSYSTFRSWCRQAGLGKVRRRRSSKVYLARERSAQQGFLLQLDGSPHRWNGTDEWCLIAAIDDATSDLAGARFFPTETTWGCLNVLRQIITKYGVPEFLLTDCAGWSTGSLKRENFSQFIRACEELDIRVIGTPSAEAKGRIERAFRTIQDRLVPEMELYGIRSMADANRYLEQCYLPDWQDRHRVVAASKESRYRSVPVGIDLKEVLCIKEKRTVNRDHTISYKTKRLRLEIDRKTKSLWKKEITIHEYEDGTFALFHGGTRIPYSEMASLRPRSWVRRAS